MQLVQQNRLSHALLFLGKEGSGALPLALAFSQYVVCERVNGKTPAAPEPSLFGEPEPVAAPTGIPEDACGVCLACQKAAKMVHPDIHYCYPVIPKKSGDQPLSTDYITQWRSFMASQPYGNTYDWLQFINAENKQGNITAEECNVINKVMSLKSFESQYKILVLWMPEYLTKNGNKLLKLIEEPPPNTLFLLVAENQERILPTILSRTQLIKIPQPSNADITEALISQAQVSPEKAAQLAAISAGNYHQALHLLQHNEEDWHAMLREWLNIVVKRNLQAQVKWVDETSKIGREKQKQFLQYFTHLLQLAIRQRIIGDAATAGYSEPEQEFAGKLNKISSYQQQEAIIDLLNNASYYIERNANAKMLFLALSIKLYHIISNNSLILLH